MQTAKARGSPKESPQKASPRPARQLKINPTEHNSPSSSTHSSARTPKDRSPKVTERRSPRSPLPEKKRPSKLSELESQITKLQDDLKKVKDQLVASESLKKEAQEDAEQARKQLADVSQKLEESQKQVSVIVASEEAGVKDLQNTAEEKLPDWESLIDSAREEHLVEKGDLESAREEIQKLNRELEKVAKPQDIDGEIQSLRGNLEETLSLMESMKHELKDSRESEAEAQKLVRRTLEQLDAAKDTVNALRSDVVRSTEAYNSVASELEQSRARVSFLEAFVSKLNSNLAKSNGEDSTDCNDDQRSREDVNQLELELQTLRSDVGQFKSALEAADIRYNEELSHSTEKLRNASELLEQVTAQAGIREAELKAELTKAKTDIEELKANLMDKETELQGISDENDSLNMKIEKSMSCQREEHQLETELRMLNELVAEMKGNLMDKETELQNILEENEMLKLKIKRQETDKGVESDQVNADVAAARAAEQEAMAKLGFMMEEADKSSRRAARVAEQLEAAQKASGEMEAELRRLKVQSDQWRKAAEAAASMLSPGGNGKFVERTGSMDGNYSPIGGRGGSPYLDEFDDSFKKKNGNVLRKIGVLWKKPQK